MATPLTTKDVMEVFGENIDDIEQRTSSFSCRSCKSRIWFFGDGDKIAKTVLCPYCNTTTKNMLQQ